MKRLETELRELFAERTSEVPALRDPMDSVVREARRARRRQRGVVAAAVAVVVTATLLAGFSVTGHFRSTPPVSPVPPAGSVELIVNDELVWQDGTRIPLEGERHLREAVRTPAGLLYLDAGGVPRLFRPDGTIQNLQWQLGRLSSLTVSRDGRKFAAARMSGEPGVVRATLSAQHGIQDIEVMRGPAAIPQGWHGGDVVLRAVTESTRQRYGLWRGDAAEPEGWGDAKGVFLLGGSSDQRWYWGRRRGDDKKWCLVQLDPLRRFTVVRELCDLGLSKTTMTSVSPDGHFLVMSEPDKPGSLRMMDLTSSLTVQSLLSDCRSSSGFPHWAGRDVLVFGDVVCRVTPSVGVVVESLPSLPAKARVIPVIRYGA